MIDYSFNVNLATVLATVAGMGITFFGAWMKLNTRVLKLEQALAETARKFDESVERFGKILDKYDLPRMHYRQEAQEERIRELEKRRGRIS